MTLDTIAAAMATPVRAIVEPRQSFVEVLRAHQGMVFSIAYHFLRDRGAAEEVAQDVFLQLHRSFADLDTGDRVMFWLRKVTSNRSIDYMRRRKLRQAVALGDAPGPRGSGEPADLFLRKSLAS